MSCATNFLPIFDSILDSFEVLRAKEPFCFAVILFLASCIEASSISHQCAQRVKDLMAASLFSYPASLGKVQGMILLVAYAENTWFAIGHALQMALDLGLDNTLSHEQIPDHISHLTHSESGETGRSQRKGLACVVFNRKRDCHGHGKAIQNPQGFGSRPSPSDLPITRTPAQHEARLPSRGRADSR